MYVLSCVPVQVKIVRNPIRTVGIIVIVCCVVQCDLRDKSYRTEQGSLGLPKLSFAPSIRELNEFFPFRDVRYEAYYQARNSTTVY